MKFGDYINEAKLKALDIPLTDSEIKQLAGFRKKEERNAQAKGAKGRFGSRSRNWDLYQNLIKRESVPQADYELKTMAQIKKMQRGQSYAFDAINLFGNPKRYSWAIKSRISLSKYLDKSENIEENQMVEFIEQNRNKIEKMRKSKPFKELVLNNIIKDISSNNYNNNIPSDIVEWAIKILSKQDIDVIVGFDGYKLYQYLEINTSTDSWVSYQGASMTDKKAKVIFDTFDEEKEFHLGTSGYWN